MANGHTVEGQLRRSKQARVKRRGLDFTAIVAAGDSLAVGAAIGLERIGRRVPDDVSIVGIDDVHESAYSTPPLTTYHVPKHALGDVAVATLDALLTSSKPPAAAKIALAGHVVARDSCSNPPD